MSSFFSCNRTFFKRKEVAQIFIFHIESPAPEAVPLVQLLDGSNLERKIQSLGSIPSNIDRNYQLLFPRLAFDSAIPLGSGFWLAFDQMARQDDDRAYADSVDYAEE